MALRLRLLFVLVVFLVGLPAGAETISGRARVVDGDTVQIGSERLRLSGIDAPEHDQTCERGGRVWACGRAASAALAEAIGRARLVCEVTGRDRYGRGLSACRAGSVDLGEAMVRQGAAIAYVKYSTRYLAAEAEARAKRRGIWQGTMIPPEDWRHGWVPQGAPGCVIKGNIGAHGRIYHLPGQADYGGTRIDEAKGERWFCTEAEARAAGFRAALR